MDKLQFQLTLVFHHYAPTLPDARPQRCMICMAYKHSNRTAGDREDSHDRELPLDSDDEDVPLIELCQRKVPPPKPDAENSEDDLPLAAGQRINHEAPKNYWKVSDDDIRREFPGAICCRADRRAPVWMTPVFLFEMCMTFHECLNARELRRRLASLYSSHALAEQVRAEREGVAPYSFAWAVASIPGNHILQKKSYSKASWVSSTRG